jgi:hypothetical protein
MACQSVNGKALDVVKGFTKSKKKNRDPVAAVTGVNPRVIATVALLGYDYLCTFVMPFVITVALCISWLVLKTEALLRAR